MEKHIQHRRISVATRNAAVITAVNNGATSAALAAEYGVQWDTIRDSIRNDHYSVNTRPSNMPRYQRFLAKVRANDAAAVMVNHSAVTSKPLESSAKEDPDKLVEPLPCPAETTTDIVTSPATNTPCPVLVETGIFMNFGVKNLLSLNEGKYIYYVPRFCIEELANLSESEDPKHANDKEPANVALLELYSNDVWDKRIIPFEPVEMGLFNKASAIAELVKRGFSKRDIGPRDFGIVEAALELHIASDARVNVLTTSKKIQYLVNWVAKEVHFDNYITVTRLSRK